LDFGIEASFALFSINEALQRQGYLYNEITIEGTMHSISVHCS